MDGLTSPARFLAYLMAEHDISITQLCRRSGMDSADAWAFLAGRLPVTPALAEQLGRAYDTNGCSPFSRPIRVTSLKDVAALRF